MTKKKLQISGVILNITIIIILFLMLYPLAMAFWGAFKSDYSFSMTKWFPTLPLRVTNISTAWPNIYHYILNTFFIATVGTIGSITVASLAAYAFARLQFPGKNMFYMMALALMMIPGVLTLVPSFMLYKEIVGLNNYVVLILPMIGGGSIFGVFLLRTFFEGLPESIFEAARIDGANEVKIYYQICIPLSLSIMWTLAIMQIVNAWNDYLWPMITIEDDKFYTISAGLLLRFKNAVGTNYPVTFSGYLLSSIPLILIFFFASKYYVQGLTSSAIKM